MKLDVHFPELEDLVRSIGASPVRWVSDAEPLSALEPFASLPESELRQRLQQGILIDKKNEGTTQQVVPLVTKQGPVLTYQGEQVILYIRDTQKSKEILEGAFEQDRAEESSKEDKKETTDERPRFHVAWCRKLEDMEKDEKLNRYVMTDNTSGYFEVDFYNWKTKEGGEIVCTLNVCKYCLRKTKYGDYHKLRGDDKERKAKAVAGFSLRDFFKKHDSVFPHRPKYTAKNVPPNEYPKNWEQISREKKIAQKWTCEQCNVDLSEHVHRYLLHTHHINKIKGDCGSANLRVLCVACHTEQHNHMKRKALLKSNPEAQQLRKIEHLRREQDLSLPKVRSPKTAREKSPQFV